MLRLSGVLRALMSGSAPVGASLSGCEAETDRDRNGDPAPRGAAPGDGGDEEVLDEAAGGPLWKASGRGTFVTPEAAARGTSACPGDAEGPSCADYGAQTTPAAAPGAPSACTADTSGAPEDTGLPDDDVPARAQGSPLGAYALTGRTAGQAGAETLSGAADAALLGGAANNSLDVGACAGVPRGREGADTLSVDGAEVRRGGAGDDRPSGRGAGARVAEAPGGGDGQDTPAPGEGGVAPGGSVADGFFLGPWTAAPDGASLMRFDPDADRIVVFYDPDTDPTLTLETDPETPEVTRLRLDGTVVASLSTASAPALGDIALLPVDLAPVLRG